jgi:hypothetical protein
MFYVRCGVVARDNGTAFYTFPTNCRIKGRAIKRRTTVVEIPFADGVKEIADGKVGKGAVQVKGRFSASTAEDAEDLCAAMELALAGRDSAELEYHIWTDRGSGTPPAYPVIGAANVNTTIVDAVGEVWIDVAVTFTRNGLSV